MGEFTKISWVDSTWNPWIGCTHAGPGCDHCYAEAQNKFRKWNGGTWGDKAPRQVTATQTWRDPLSWEDKACAGRVGKDGQHWLVFAGDLCDIFDRLGDKDARIRMWELFRQTPHLTWLILTMRPQHIAEFLPADWDTGYRNVWLGVTVENRKNGYPRIEALRRIPATLRFISCEPLLENMPDIELTGIDWVIVGGESGSEARPFDIEWARVIKGRCQDFSTVFFLKQLGGAPLQDGSPFKLDHCKSRGWRDSHGVLLENFPPDLRIQRWPMRERIHLLETTSDVPVLLPGGDPTNGLLSPARKQESGTATSKLSPPKEIPGRLERFAREHELVLEIEDYPDAISEDVHLVPRICLQDAFITDPFHDPFLVNVLGSKEAVKQAVEESNVDGPLLLILLREQIDRLSERIGFELPNYEGGGSAGPQDQNSSVWAEVLHRTGLRYVVGSDDGMCFLFSECDTASIAVTLALTRIR